RPPRRRAARDHVFHLETAGLRGQERALSRGVEERDIGEAVVTREDAPERLGRRGAESTDDAHAGDRDSLARIARDRETVRHSGTTGPVRRAPRTSAPSADTEAKMALARSSSGISTP